MISSLIHFGVGDWRPVFGTQVSKGSALRPRLVSAQTGTQYCWWTLARTGPTRDSSEPYLSRKY